MFNINFKRFLTYLLTAIFTSSFLTFLYIFFPNLLDSIDNRIRDSYFIYRGEVQTTQSVIIVDIDDKSLKELGQWPWSRDKIAHIIDNLTKADVGIIGMDMVFSEEDRTSPSFLNHNKNLTNYDEIFAKTIDSSPIILGYSFDLVDSNSSSATPKIPAIFVEKNRPDGSDFLIKAKGTLLNIPVLQDSAYSSGFFNILPDESGVIRSIPLIISYDDSIYPSLSLELLRILNDTKKVVVDYDDNGIKSIALDELIIPTDRYGRMLINYRGYSKSFNYISAIDIYKNEFKKDDIEGKIALFGTSATGLYDLRSTPFESVFAGVEIHANAIDNILAGDFIEKSSYLDGANIAIIILLGILSVFAITFANFYLKPILLLLFASLYIIISYKIMFEHGVVLNIVFALLAIVLGGGASIVLDYFYNIKNEQAIKQKFASKVSKSVMDDILKNLHKDGFSVKTKVVTIFFSDIRGFTKISEKLGAAELIAFLNRYMEPMSKIIIEHQGTIDKFIGDAIMAYWNAPLDLKNHADMALKASIVQLKELEKLNEILQKENLPLIKIGIGLNSGEVVVGEMGSSLRSDYTVIGDAINLGSRVESLTKYYDSTLNITNYTKELLKDDYLFRFLDLVKVKGKDEPVEIWQVLTKEPTKELLNELELYHGAIEFYKKANFKEALAILKNLQNETIYEIYKQRCEEFLQTPPKHFDGVYEHTTKG